MQPSGNNQGSQKTAPTRSSENQTWLRPQHRSSFQCTTCNMCLYRVRKVSIASLLCLFEENSPVYRLQNNDVKIADAQSAACVSMSDFKNCLKIVTAAFEEDERHSATTRTSSRTSSYGFYDHLAISSGIPAPKTNVVEWANRAESLLSLDERAFDPNNVPAKNAVFMWVYAIIHAHKTHVRPCSLISYTLI